MERCSSRRRQRHLGAVLAAAVLAPGVEPIAQTDHWVNWYRCMRDGKTPNAPLDAGYQHAAASIMATMSYETGRRARYDAAKRTIVTD